MSSTLGNKVKVTVFGQSHSEAIGCCVEGMPAGETFSMDELLQFMARRAPGRNSQSTQRKEKDFPEFLSGVLANDEDIMRTCGTPLCAIIRNGDCHSGDYENLRDTPRPGHADWTAQMKYQGFQDIRGGGHFSGRLTAPLCIAGGICKQILKRQGIDIAAHIASVGDIEDERFDSVNPQRQMDILSLHGADDFPTLSDNAGERMKGLIDECRQQMDSIGGSIECSVTGLEGGLGDPMFDGIENIIAKAIFGIPAVKGIEFGAGFEVAKMRGSQNNDAFTIKNGKIVTVTNNHGGILGGISSSMPIIFRTAFKPTPSIAQPQQSVSIAKKEIAELVIKGRHDPCIVHRAVPVVEAVTAIVLYDLLQSQH